MYEQMIPILAFCVSKEWALKEVITYEVTHYQFEKCLYHNSQILDNWLWANHALVIDFVASLVEELVRFLA